MRIKIVNANGNAAYNGIGTAYDNGDILEVINVLSNKDVRCKCKREGVSNLTFGVDYLYIDADEYVIVDETKEFNVGDTVRVKRWYEIAKTLDDVGRCDGVSFPQGFIDEFCDNEFVIDRMITDDRIRYTFKDHRGYFISDWFTLVKKKTYKLSDFKKTDVAYKTAIAEIKDKELFDEFGNLIKEI